MVSQNRVLRGALGAGGQKRKVQNEKLHNLYQSPNIMVNKSRLRLVGCKLGYKNYVQNFILKEHGFRLWMSFVCLRTEASGRFLWTHHTTRGHTWGQGGNGYIVKKFHNNPA
jgi:hypothetical protein